jgi:hypothetical protein
MTAPRNAGALIGMLAKQRPRTSMGEGQLLLLLKDGVVSNGSRIGCDPAMLRSICPRGNRSLFRERSTSAAGIRRPLLASFDQAASVNSRMTIEQSMASMTNVSGFIILPFAGR